MLKILRQLKCFPACREFADKIVYPAPGWGRDTRAASLPFAKCREVAQCWRVRRGEARAWINGDERNERGISSARERKQTARQVSLRKPSFPVETARTRLPFPSRCTSRVTAAARSRCAFDQTGGFLRARAAIADRTKRRSLFVPGTSPPFPSIPFVRSPPSCRGVLRSRVSHPPRSGMERAGAMSRSGNKRPARYRKTSIRKHAGRRREY